MKFIKAELVVILKDKKQMRGDHTTCRLVSTSSTIHPINRLPICNTSETETLVTETIS